MRKAVIALGTVALLAGCGGEEPPTSTAPSSSSATPTETPTADTFTIAGDMKISMFDSYVTGRAGGSALYAAQNDDCVGDGGFDDIREGAQVVVRVDGETVAVGDLGPGRIQMAGSDCKFLFEIEDVPGEHNFYSVEVSHRGELTYDREEVQEILHFTLD